MARLSRRSKGTTALALLASTALLAGLIAGPGAVASGGDGATTAAKKKKKKKCKPGFRKVVKIVKKNGKKKKRKRCVRVQTPSLLPDSGVRATLRWDAVPPGSASNVDFDLWVFDAAGNRARAAANTIPNSLFSANAITSPGTETFTDTAFKALRRNFSFGVCYQDGGSTHAQGTLTYVTADGVQHTQTTPEFGSDGAHIEVNAGAPLPANYCKAP